MKIIIRIIVKEEKLYISLNKKLFYYNSFNLKGLLIQFDLKSNKMNLFKFSFSKDIFLCL